MQRIIALACTALLAFGTARADTTLVISIAADPTGFDPEAVPNNTSGFIMAAMYDGLVRYKPGTAEVEPGLAKSWDISADGLTYTFHLRTGIKFHDGTPFNATGIDRDAGSPAQEGRSELRSTIPGPVEGYEDFTYGSVASYSALDDSTVEFKMKEPSAAFLNSLAMVWNGVVSPTRRRNTARISATIRSAPGRSSSANGSERDQIMLDANPDYWKGKPKVDHLVFKEYPDAQAALLALKRGEMQIMGDVATQVIARSADGPEYRAADAAGPGGERDGDAERHAAIQRQAGAPGAELRGGQGSDRTRRCMADWRC